jgi:hypothetical protein
MSLENYKFLCRRVADFVLSSSGRCLGALSTYCRRLRDPWSKRPQERYISSNPGVQMSYLALHLSPDLLRFFVSYYLHLWEVSFAVPSLTLAFTHRLKVIFPTRCKPLTSPETFSDDSLSQAIQWLHECEMYHAVCNQEAIHSSCRPKILPTRLLDVGTLASPDTKLVNSNEFIGGVEYFTLSHCWGGKLPIKLTRSCLGELQSGIEFATLPRTFQEAIYITRIFKSRYLWIDALCIIQDSEQDWFHESSIMGQVYANSRLNLAATASSDSQGGLRRHRDPRLVGACVISPSWTGLGQMHRQYTCAGYDVWRTNVEAAPLQRRGWVLQERMLAPRILHFAEQQLFWECYANCASESIPTELPPSISGRLKGKLIRPVNCSKDHLRRRLQAEWPGIVEAYSTATLTYDKDKLIAISGIAKQMLEMWDGSPGDYLAGLWRDNIHHQLLWRARGSTVSHLRPNYYRAPSWSWASLDGRIFVSPLYAEHSRVEQSTRLVNIMEAEVTPSNNLSTSVKRGHVRLQGPICRMRRVVELTVDLSRKFMPKETSNHWKIDGRTMPGFEVYMDDDTSKSNIQTYHFVGFFESVLSNPTRKWLTGMILQPTGGADGEYRRCGVFNAMDEEARAMIKAGFATQKLEKIEYEESNDYRYTIKII